MIRNCENYSTEDTMQILDVEATQVKRLLKNGSLTETEEFGETKISGNSILECLIGKKQRTPKGYISMANVVKNTGFNENVVLGAILRGELDAIPYRQGNVIELNGFSLWFSFLLSHKRICLARQYSTLSGKITVKNIWGIHGRPSSDIFQLSSRYQAINTKLILKLGDKKAHGEELLEIAALGARYKEALKYEIDGDFCEMFETELKDLFSGFDKYRKQTIIEMRYDLKALDEDIRLSHL